MEKKGPSSLLKSTTMTERKTPMADHGVTLARKAGGWCPDRWWRTWQRKRAAVEGEGG
ncbi:hypothetical protein CXB51_036485 [Gossypium anomalum]|uniref:Uncharacterized protein n=1 Tax=Gossypium anomalum TaxID=47600 RepID=A0A8J5XP30_9ROSI|nr:hypothetical protein CXB51_036485 [Gossypium anomalum]